ncbi:MAG: hypothetical protein LEGION0398_MBIBDBAK_01433 [Legionellaceae bacterium]
MATLSVLLDSRIALWDQLNQLLALCNYKREVATLDEQRYGGLGGIIIEGESGIGKSELVLALLEANDYKEKKIDTSSEIIDSGKYFYRIPVSLPIEKKEMLLLEAFNNGALVIIDEINSAPIMERLFNSLLMGKTIEGKKPAKPGFFLIATQNPVSMAGRRIMSDALSHRLLKVTLPPYTSNEMKMILCGMGLDETQVSELLKAYDISLNKAKREKLSPAPTFRDVLRIASEINKAENVKVKKENKNKILFFNQKDLEAKEFFDNLPDDQGYNFK